MRKIVQIRDAMEGKYVFGDTRVADASFVIEDDQGLKFTQPNYEVLIFTAPKWWFFHKNNRYIECGFILEF